LLPPSKGTVFDSLKQKTVRFSFYFFTEDFSFYPYFMPKNTICCAALAAPILQEARLFFQKHHFQAMDGGSVMVQVSLY
jgi:hypothetical protein